MVDGKAPPEMSALKPYWGKPAVRNFREGDGNNGIIEARSAPSPYSTGQANCAAVNIASTACSGVSASTRIETWAER